MDFVVFLAALIVWGVVWVQLYRMYRRRAWGWGVSQLVSGTLGTVAAFFVVVLALGVGLIEARQAGETSDVSTPPAVEAVAEDTASEPVSASPPAASKTFGFDDKRYLERLKQTLKKAEHTSQIEAEPVKRGEVNDSRSIMLSPLVGISLSLDKHSGQINAITVVGTGDGTHASGFEIILLTSAALSAAVPGASVGEVMKKLPLLLEDKPVQFGNIRLSAHKMGTLGTWFYAEPV
ncbi:hypothetical protein IFT75_15230 [Pseudomonas sp. CFBP 8758]|uniref:hypothetical protein n=1 Tax=Pseudomonas sp. CFBP 8758 TaxID=2775286 RepID=UPI0017850153|nr:hypothetical protein [Pseudomonas sp. CFBP 8758]MBD8594766.1 hypothetical protein [Pseudomonas sp. CFBP 8758]